MKTLSASFVGVLLAFAPASVWSDRVPAWIERLGWTLVHSIWQLATVAIIAAIVDRALRRRSADARYIAGVTALSFMLTLPCVTWTLVAVESRSDQTVMASVPDIASRRDTAPIEQTTYDNETSPHPARRGGSRDFARLESTTTSSSAESREPLGQAQWGKDRDQIWPRTLAWAREAIEPRLPWLVALWLAGVVLCSLRPAWGLWTQWRLRRVGLSPVSEPVQRMLLDLARRMRLAQVVRIAESAFVRVPMVVGYLRPMILLPASVLIGLTPTQLEAVLAHELAHVRRHDWLINTLQVLAETLLFYHPAVWWLSNRIRHERELCCDDSALSLIYDKAVFARTLLLLEELRQSAFTPALAATGGDLAHRVRRLLPTGQVSRRQTQGAGATVLVTLCLSFALFFGMFVASRRTVATESPPRAGRGSPDPALDPTAGLPNADEETNPPNNANGDLRSNPAAGSGDTSRAQVRILTPNVTARDWPQWGGTIHRNNVAVGQTVPMTWNIETRENIKWSVPLGSETYSSPVIANGKVFIGTNNGHGYVKEHPASEDVSCLLVFDETTGKFLWQASNLKLPAGRAEDWPNIGICSTPYCEGDRVWYVTNRAKVMCLDAEGFHDDENDGPVTDERLSGPDHADIVWRFDLMAKLGMKPRHATNCSVTCLGDRLFVVVSHGVDAAKTIAAQPKAPSFICLDKRTGQLLWSEDSVGENMLECQWSSPCVFEAGGQWQVAMGGGDGWVYSFDPVGDGQGRAKLLWKFDTNPKESIYMLSRATRNYCVATPVFYDGYVYIGNGQNPEKGEGIGHLYCIDPTKRGDVSSELAVDAQSQPLAPRRLKAVEAKQGEKAIPNPNSAMVWHYSAVDRAGLGKPKFEESFHRTVGSAAIADDLLFVADFSGLLHCLDAKKSVNGQPVVHWTHELLAACWSTPIIADGKVFITDEDGDVTIFKLSAQKTVLSEHNLGATIYTTPAVANNTLFLATKNRLLAIADPKVAAAGDPRRAQQPQSKESRALFQQWQRTARTNGNIPGGTLGPLVRVMRNFVKNNPTHEGSPKFAELLKRIEVTRDWSRDEAVKLVDDVAAIYPSLPEWVEGEKRFSLGGDVVVGKPLPEELKDAPWGEAPPNGLRVAWLLEPRGEEPVATLAKSVGLPRNPTLLASVATQREPRGAEQRLNTPLKSRVLYQNSGKNSVVFRALTWNQSGGHKARDAQGTEININSTEWTTIPMTFACRLAPGEFIEVVGAGIGVGANKDDEDWRDARSDFRVGAWIEAKAGDEVTFSPATVDVAGREGPHPEEEAAETTPQLWWLKFIQDRLSLDAPLPAAVDERRRLLDRAVRDLFGNAPTEAELTAFQTDATPAAFDSLAKRLSERTGFESFSGSLISGPTKFKVLPVDPDAAKKPRSAKGPGQYPLGGATFVVTRRTIDERIVNEAHLSFSPTDATKPAPRQPHPVPLPDDYDSWIAAWMRGGTVLWVAQKGADKKDSIRRYDFTNPESVKETVITELKTSEALPQAILDALRTKLAFNPNANGVGANNDDAANSKPAHADALSALWRTTVSRHRVFARDVATALPGRRDK